MKHRNNFQIESSHNSGLSGTEKDGEELLPSVKDFFSTIPENDKVILITARHSTDWEITEKALERFDLLSKIDSIIYDLPSGPRILINDIKTY